MKLAMLIEMTQITSVPADVMKAMNAISWTSEGPLRWKRETDGSFLLMNSTLGVDERSDEGSQRKSQVKKTLRDLGYKIGNSGKLNNQVRFNPDKS